MYVQKWTTQCGARNTNQSNPIKGTKELQECILKHMARKNEKLRKQRKIQFVGTFEKRVSKAVVCALLEVILYLQSPLLTKLRNVYFKR